MPNSNKKNLRIILNSGAVVRIPKTDIDSITLPKTNINGRHVSKQIDFKEVPHNFKRRKRR